MGVRRPFLFLAILGFLAGCVSYDLSSGRGREVTGDGFIQELYPRYDALSQALQVEGDVRDSEHFNLKARDASMRSPVLPDEPMDRDLDDEANSIFEAARYDLLLFFNDRGAREKAPARAADAQVSFDCWMEATEAGRSESAEICRRAFEEALTALVAEAPDAPRPFIVYFEFDSAEVDGTGIAMIDRALEDAQRYGVNEFSVTGHTDRAGSQAYNEQLSLRRAQAVAAALQLRGVPDSNIFIAGRGKSETLVPTEDGVRERQNRRVEIVIQ